MRIGILTGGGDVPGLNAAIRAVARRALGQGIEVFGVRNGWGGLIGDGDVHEMHLDEISGILALGGTILGSSRTNPLRDPAQLDQVVENLSQRGIDRLVAMGGDDTLSVAEALYQRGIPVVGVPKTMDNDLQVTEYCIGFDTAVARVTEALDRLHTTAASHHRLMVLEVMGRDTGWVALMGGLAGGADIILLPEYPVGIEDVVSRLERRRAEGRDFSILVVAEGVNLTSLGLAQVATGALDQFGHPQLSNQGVGSLLSDRLSQLTDFEARVTVLGHTQRGGSPTAYDRVWASAVGSAAFDLALEGRAGMIPVKLGGRIESVRISEVVASQRRVPEELYRLAGSLH